MTVWRLPRARRALIVLAGLMLALSVVSLSSGTNGRYEARPLVSVLTGPTASRVAAATVGQARAIRVPKRFERDASHLARGLLLAAGERVSLRLPPRVLSPDGRHLYMRNCTLRR